MKVELPIKRLTHSDAPPPETAPLDHELRGYLDRNADIVKRILKPVALDDIGALSAQSETPILFENIVGYPGFRICEILVKSRMSQARALGVCEPEYLRTLSYRLRQPARGVVKVKSGPVKEVIWLGDQADLSRLPVPLHKENDRYPYLSAMIILRDPETGFYNTAHAGTSIIGPQTGLSSFATSHSLRILGKYREMGAETMPMAFAVGVPPAYEIMAGTSPESTWIHGAGDRLCSGRSCSRILKWFLAKRSTLDVPSHAEMIIEGNISLERTGRTGDVTSPSMYHLPHFEDVPAFQLTAITMRADRPIYRNHQTCPSTDHQILPRLCHEAVLYNRLVEMGLDARDVRFPAWGGALSCLLQFDYNREGQVNDALLMAMGAPWINTKLVVAFES